MGYVIYYKMIEIECLEYYSERDLDRSYVGLLEKATLTATHQDFYTLAIL